MLRYGWVVSALLWTGAASPAAPAPGQWVVVTAPAFRKAIEPLCEHRKAQGMSVVVVETTDVLRPEDVRAGDGHKLREHLHKLCRGHDGPSYILLVGAVEAGKLKDPESKVVPTLPGTVGRMKGQPSDNAYGCLDDGRLPTVAVGRFPAHTEEEARGMVAKTLEYETDSRPGTWKRRLVILAGIPAYNPLVDRLVETLALSRFARLSPAWTGRAIYSNPQSMFSLPDSDLHAHALRYVQDGEAFIVYLGHSNALGLYGGGRYPFLDRDDWSRREIGRGKGVFLTFGCNGCQLKGEDGEGYGVAAVRNPHGPVAAVGSHGICFAAMVQLAADGLFESTFVGRPPERLGASWLALKNGLARGKIDDLTFNLLNAVDGDRSIPQAAQRQEHLEMFVLLGDPALRLPAMPADVELTGDLVVSAGETLNIRGKVPERLRGARVRLTLERPVNSAPDGLEQLPKDEAAADIVRRANHERSNRFVLAAGQCSVVDGRFSGDIRAPVKLSWPRLILRAYAATDREEGVAVRIVDVKRDKAAKP